MYISHIARNILVKEASSLDSSQSPTQTMEPADCQVLVGLGLLSMAVLAFEINLTRIFSVGQFYHFAFLIVSIALLGSGASGSMLAIFPRLGRGEIKRTLTLLSFACGVSILCSYLITNWLPFDSYRMAVDSGEILKLMGHFVLLSLPFFMSGLATSILLSRRPQSAGQTYAANLLGSAMGCLIALITPALLSGEGVVVLSASLAFIPSGYLAIQSWRRRAGWRDWRMVMLAVIFLGFCLTDLILRLSGNNGLPAFDLKLSPYKGLSYALQYPGAKVVSSEWNSFSRVDVVNSAGIHSLPGLSYRYLDPPPRQDGILIDGDDLNPLVLPTEHWGFASYLPAALPFHLKPDAEALILEPRGGLDIIVALDQGAKQITAVEANPLVIRAASYLYQDPAVNLVVESGRSFLRRTPQQYDVIIRSLTSAYRPVSSGAYSLAEDYRYTLEAFQDALARLSPDGIFYAQHWLQTPPCEEMRLFALAVSAVEATGDDPARQVAALRGYNTAAVLVKKSPFTRQDLNQIRAFASERAFDLVYLPGMQAEETNIFNRLPEDLYFRDFSLLLSAPREQFYEHYPHQIEPPTDDRPFFGHFFKWSQAAQIIQALGKTWQPFGGAGYFVLLLLLILAIFVSLLLILLPVAITSCLAKRQHGTSHLARNITQIPGASRWIIYFVLLGFGFLLVEITLVQRFTLYLDQPAYSFSTVVFSLLLFSAAGSQLSHRMPLRFCLPLLVLLLMGYIFILPAFFNLSIGIPLPVRLVLSVLILAPAGFFMGIPFPGAIARLGPSISGSAFIAWVWAVNGTSSVIAAVLAALLALSFGYTVVLWIGVCCYLGATVIVLAQVRTEMARIGYPVR